MTPNQRKSPPTRTPWLLPAVTVWTPRPGYERRPAPGRAVDARTPPPHRPNLLQRALAALRGLLTGRSQKNDGSFRGRPGGGVCLRDLPKMY